MGRLNSGKKLILMCPSSSVAFGKSATLRATWISPSTWTITDDPANKHQPNNASLVFQIYACLHKKPHLSQEQDVAPGTPHPISIHLSWDCQVSWPSVATQAFHQPPRDSPHHQVSLAAQHASKPPNPQNRNQRHHKTKSCLYSNMCISD